MNYLIVRTDIVAMSPEHASELLASCPKVGGLIRWTDELVQLHMASTVDTSVIVDSTNSILYAGRTLLHAIVKHNKTIMVTLVEMAERGRE